MPSSRIVGGMRMSVRTTPTSTASTAVYSSSTLPHEATSSMPGSLSRICSRPSRINRLSSACTTRTGIGSGTR
jgi:hypothetical protein